MKQLHTRQFSCRGFNVIESVVMLVLLAVFSMVSLAVARKYWSEGLDASVPVAGTPLPEPVSDSTQPAGAPVTPPVSLPPAGQAGSQPRDASKSAGDS